MILVGMVNEYINEIRQYYSFTFFAILESTEVNLIARFYNIR